MTETIPDVITPKDLSEYLAVMTRAVFQAGVSWKQIAQHWSAYREIFDEFNVARVASFGEADVQRVLDTSGILHSTRKVQATVHNAQMLQAIDAEQGFTAYLHGFPGYDALAKDIKRRFSFMGEMNAWYFLFRVGEPVPQFDAWVTTIPGEHPRMREMVERARQQGRSSERPIVVDGSP